MGNYYRHGRSYRLYSQGTEIGRVAITHEIKLDKVEINDCHTMNVFVSANFFQGKERADIGIATNVSVKSRETIKRRSVTDSELSILKNFARTAFRQKKDAKIDQAAIAALKVINDSTAGLLGNGQEQLVGGFVVKTIDGFAARYYMAFIIAERSSSGTYTQVFSLVDDTGDTATPFYGVIDLLDLDGDGIDEIVAHSEYREWITDEILKKENGIWRRTGIGGWDSC
jgi:hypothetical protein